MWLNLTKVTAAQRTVIEQGPADRENLKKWIYVQALVALICRIRESESSFQCVLHLCSSVYVGVFNDSVANNLVLGLFVCAGFRWAWRRVWKATHTQTHTAAAVGRGAADAVRKGDGWGLRGAKSACPRWRGLSGTLPIKREPGAHSQWQCRGRAHACMMYLQPADFRLSRLFKL